MLISFAGKGGVGKTTILSLLLDEIARRGYAGRVLVIDADPAGTLAMQLGLEQGPATTLAEVRTSTPLTARQVRDLPEGVAPAQHVLNLLHSQGCLIDRRLREMPFHFFALGYEQQPGCYCRLNRALTALLNTIRPVYDLILVDNEPGLEHISRHRLNRIEMLLLVMTPGQSSWAVGNRLRYLAGDLGLQIAETWEIYNRGVKTGRRFATAAELTIFLPESDTLDALDRQGGTPVYLIEEHPLRLALAPIVDRICGPADEAPVVPDLSNAPTPHQIAAVDAEIATDDAGLETLERDVVDLWND